MKDSDFEEISSTAIVTSYPRTFTDIPYESEIYCWLSNHLHEEVVLDKALAPELEARYKLINKLLDKSKIKQVLELAAGYTSRGFVYSNRGYCYVEMDLEVVSNHKIKILQSIAGKIPPTLNIVSGNVLKKLDYKKCQCYFDKHDPVAVINEGLLRYLTFDEKRVVAKNVYSFLKKYGGIWITSDVTPKSFIQAQDKALPDFNKKLNHVTSRNNLHDRFEDISHVKQFFGEIGFEVVEVHKFSEMKPDLYSIYHYNIINDHIDELLERAIVVIMKIKEVDLNA